MTVVERIALIKDLITIAALFIGGSATIFIYFQWAPVLTLRILPRWADDAKAHLIIRFEVENKSRVRASQLNGRYQVLKHTLESGQSISRWVPFDKDAIRSGEKPIEWEEPVKVFTSTRRIYPGETIAFENLYHCPEDYIIFHIGFQVNVQLTKLERIITRKKESWQQTTTSFIVKTPSGKGAE